MASSFEKSVKGATKIKESYSLIYNSSLLIMAAPPKTKYIEHILIATHAGEHGVAEVFRALQNRLRDSTWTVVFKSLITVHLMIREGSPDVTLAYLAQHRNILAVNNFSDMQTQGRNIRHYSNYLTDRARAYRDTKCDFVRAPEERLEKISVEKGLLRETEAVQKQITALLKCDVLDNEPENEITITVFRLLVLDLLPLFQVLNFGVINILGHFFEMSRVDAERALDIYRGFATQTDFVVAYLNIARQYEHHTRVEVPKLKHAPINLGKQLEDYLNDPDFEVNRRQYLAEQDAKKGRKGTNGARAVAARKEAEAKTAAGHSFPDAGPSASQPSQTSKGPDPDLIDFFDSIEQNQQPMAVQPVHQAPNMMPQYAAQPQMQMQPQQYQQTGFATQQTGFQGQNPWDQQQPFGNGFIQQHEQQPPPPQPLQPNFTGAGFGGYTPQPSFQPSVIGAIPQDSTANFQTPSPQQQQQPFNNMNAGQPQSLQPQSTNPFRQSMMAQPTGMSSGGYQSPPTATPLTRQNTNPFSKSFSPPQAQNAFAPIPEQQVSSFSSPVQEQAAFQQPQPMLPMATGTNPFARNSSSPAVQQRPQTSGALLPQATGSTNPFRQSQFVNTATGQGWQSNQQTIGGGLDHLETLPIFPRPAQQQAWQQ